MDIGTLRQLRESVSGNPRLQATNVLPTRGGSEPLAYPAARMRFADLVRTRERIVTAEDVLVAIRAFDSRLTTATVRSAPRVRMGVATFVDEVEVSVPAASITDQTAEPVTIRERLERHLAPRWMIGRELTVRVTVVDAGVT